MNWSLEKPAGRHAAASATPTVGKAEPAARHTAAMNARLRLEFSAQTLAAARGRPFMRSGFPLPGL